VHTANVYVAADDNAQRTATVNPGHEVVMIEKSGPWVRVFANTDTETDSEEVPLMQQDQPTAVTSGWIKAHGIVDSHTENGDAILFGAAATLEEQASQPHAPKFAAQSAHLLYKRAAEYFPKSTLAAEAAWRAADIRWQLEKQDISTLPSAHEKESFLRPQIYEGEMKHVIKTWPKSKWAARAAYALIDNQLCGDWQGLPQCPDKESSQYERYANTYPDGPRTAEALYNAAYRQGALVDIYNEASNRKRAEAAASHTKQLATSLQKDFPQSDYAARAAALVFRIDQQIAIYGNDRD
ncbi:MAG TPA: SH3 domain-containing protein, partial [Acidobacteriaceae bacterium]